jgi:cytochrome P450
MFVLILLSVFVIIIVYILARHYLTDDDCGMVGPKGYPLIGSALDIDSTRLHLKLTEWSEQFGDMFVVRMFGRKLFVLNSPDVIREALVEKPNDVIFGSRVVPSFVGQYTMSGYSDIIFSPHSSELVERRKFVHRLLKMYGDGSERLEAIIMEHLEKLVSDIRQYDGKPMDLGDVVENLLYHVVGVLVSIIQNKLRSGRTKFNK